MSNSVPFLGEIASQGILGLLLAFSIFANIYFIKKNQDINDQRVKDAQAFSDKLLEPIDAIKRNSELLIALFTKFLSGK